jgi:hypothetical protein
MLDVYYNYGRLSMKKSIMTGIILSTMALKAGSTIRFKSDLPNYIKAITNLHISWGDAKKKNLPKNQNVNFSSIAGLTTVDVPENAQYFSISYTTTKYCSNWKNKIYLQCEKGQWQSTPSLNDSIWYEVIPNTTYNIIQEDYKTLLGKKQRVAVKVANEIVG